MAVLKGLESFAGAAGKLAVTTHRSDPFRVLVSTIVSQRTRDSVTAEVSAALFARASSAAELLRLRVEDLEDLLRPAGFYRTKARHIRQACEALVESHGGRVPSTERELLALPGVGRKTATLVLSTAFDVPAICVDTHVHRISNRLGLVDTSTPERTETALMELFPREAWGRINGLMVSYGQKVCRPVRPRCSSCKFSSFCPSAI